MGVPKFFRWISERYPCLSELIKEYQIPEFDNLYLDMNGIIHTCSHPNDFDPHFRITEEKIFTDIFHYIEVLFRMIQPQQLFFMAVDGVAPRAKQNQQRGRRFRSAKEAQELEKKAKEKGEDLPAAARFDSNCITPGTPFMVRLQEQLKFFVAHKISTDDMWSKCKVILSGHETPGEGEHKIMDYIRYMKSQPDYNSNTRHCLYGLDADLIMLGLCSHEPHFSLLREEVRFDKKSNNQRTTTAEETTFFLLHLSLMREYLEHEFAPVKSQLPEGFKFDLESIIDDWVLMGFLVGNDFIPPLPEMHINMGALPILYRTYMEVLPSLGGYINEQGTLNLERFERYMLRLAKFDFDSFDEQFADLQYFKAKTGRRPGGKTRTKYGDSKKKLTTLEMEETISFSGPTMDPEEMLLLVNADKPRSRDLELLISATNSMALLDVVSSTEEDDTEDTVETVEESDEVVITLPADTGRDSPQSLMMAEFQQHKKHYYMEKLEYKEVTPEVLRSQAHGYVKAIQWNLHYYFNGVCSWSWFYPHHYAPYISDIRDFADMTFDFDMGKPYLPFQQLAAVLPAASKELLPEAYQWLMVSPESPIIHFYPSDFETDLNGKRQEWEAVVLIPFIEEKALLAAMEQCSDRLTPDERARNTHGPMYVYTHTAKDLGAMEAPAYYPALTHNHARVQRVDREEICVPIDKLVKGLCADVRLDVFFPGFPTLKHVKHTGSLSKAKVKVFEMASRGENMVLSISPLEQRPLLELGAELIGRSIYVSWPHLTEAMVVSILTREERCEKIDGQVTVLPMTQADVAAWNLSRKAISEAYMGRRGVDVGDVTVLVRALNMIGRKYVVGGQTKVTLEKQWAPIPTSYALQATVKDITVKDPQFVQYKTIEEVFPKGSTCFLMAPSRYGLMGTIVEGGEKGRLKLKLVEGEEPDLREAKTMLSKCMMTYMPGNSAGAKLGITPHLLSRVTGNIFIQLLSCSGNNNKVNVGLNLKYTKKNEEIPGYTRRIVTQNSGPSQSTWLYSQRAVELVNSYMSNFPQLFEYLAKHTGNDDFSEEEICPGQPGMVSSVLVWLKEQEYTKVERQTCGSNVLDKEVVVAIEAALDKERLTEKRSSVQVKPHLLYKPELHTGNLPPDLTASYALFDRVINVRKGFTVPLGLKGIIIAIHKADKEEEILYDVVFDQPFPGGLALNCSANRGYRMPRSALINISHGKRVEMGIAPPTEGSMHGPVDRSRPYIPQNKAFDNAGLNGPPSTYNNRQQSSRAQAQQAPTQNWRLKQPAAPPAPAPAYTLLSKPAPAPAKDLSGPSDDFAALWRNIKPPVPLLPVQPAMAMPLQQQSPTKVANTATDFLRKALGIEPTKEPLPPAKVASQKPAKATAQPQSLKQMSPEDFLALINRQNTPAVPLPSGGPHRPGAVAAIPSLLATQPALNSCARLLSVFQTKGLGTPRYNYTTDHTGLVKATLSLPTGKHFVSALAATREQSSDNAAQQALSYLASEPGNPQADNLPTPPQQWWPNQPQLQQQQQQQQPFRNLPPGVQASPAWTYNTQQPQLYDPPRPAHKQHLVGRPVVTKPPQKYVQQTGSCIQPVQPFAKQDTTSSAVAENRPGPQKQQQRSRHTVGNGHAGADLAGSRFVPPPASQQQHLIRVTGAPPVPREPPITLREMDSARRVVTLPHPAVPKGIVSSTAAPTSTTQPPVSTRIAANFKFAKKAGKSKKKPAE